MNGKRLLFVFVLSCMIGACGGDESEVSSQDVESSEDEARSVSDGDVEDPEDPWAGYTSPIDEFLGVDYGSFDAEAAQAQFAESEREAQEKIATCMRDLGWEYVPVDHSSEVFAGRDPFASEGLEYGSDGWVDKYGLGITTQAFGQSQVGPDLVGYDDSEFDDGLVSGDGTDFEDPNAEYVESLSESAQQAFYQDLYGEQPEFDETLTQEEQDALWNDWEPSGCQNEAYQGAFGDASQEFYEEFGDEISDLHERVSSDPRIVALQVEFAECLADAGHSISSDTDPMQQLYQMFDGKLEPLYESMNDSFVDPLEGLDVASMTEEEIAQVEEDARQAGPPPLGEAERAILAELQREEFDLADAVLTCDPAFFNGSRQGEVYIEVRTELEQEFLDQNAEALSKYKDSAAE